MQTDTSGQVRLTFWMTSPVRPSRRFLQIRLVLPVRAVNLLTAPAAPARVANPPAAQAVPVKAASRRAPPALPVKAVSLPAAPAVPAKAVSAAVPSRLDISTSWP